MALTRVNDHHSGTAGASQQRPHVRHDAGEAVDIETGCGRPSLCAEKIALHVDDDERGGRDLVEKRPWQGIDDWHVVVNLLDQLVGRAWSWAGARGRVFFLMRCALMNDFTASSSNCAGALRTLRACDIR